jgi:hypothetical protein
MSSDDVEAVLIQSSGETGPDQALNHAWEWTKYQAEQRLTMVRFAITMIGGVAAGIAYLWKDTGYSLCALLSLFGILGAFAALRIDMRTNDLVLIGENALEATQCRLAVQTGIDALNIARKTNIKPRCSLDFKRFPAKYRFLYKYGLPYNYTQNFRFLYVSVMCIYCIVCAFSVYKMIQVGM